MKHTYKVIIAYLTWLLLGFLVGCTLGFLKVPNFIFWILIIPFAWIITDLPKYIIKKIK